MQKPLCKFCGTRDHHSGELDKCKAMKDASKDRVGGDVGVPSPVEKAQRGPVVSRSGMDDAHLPAGGHGAASEAGVDRGGSIRESQKDVTVPLTNAERCRLWRERKKLSDPDYLRREAARMKALRERLK